MTQNSTIHDLGEKSGLRDEFAHQMRNVFLTLGRKCFLIACSTTEGDDHNFSFCR